jgi:hypothetical protein
MAPVKRASVVKRVQCKAPGGVVAMGVSLPVLTFEGEAAGEVELDLRTARPETAKSVVHRGVVCKMQNRRRGRRDHDRELAVGREAVVGIPGCVGICPRTTARTSSNSP